MKTNKNRMQAKALKKTIRDNDKASQREINRLKESVKANQVLAGKYKERLYLACEVIGRELDDNDILRAMLSQEQVVIGLIDTDRIDVNNWQHRPEVIRNCEAAKQIIFDVATLYRFGAFVRDYANHSHFGKVLELHHGGVKQCLMLDDQGMRNAPVDYLTRECKRMISTGFKKLNIQGY